MLYQYQLTVRARNGASNVVLPGIVAQNLLEAMDTAVDSYGYSSDEIESVKRTVPARDPLAKPEPYDPTRADELYIQDVLNAVKVLNSALSNAATQGRDIVFNLSISEREYLSLNTSGDMEVPTRHRDILSRVDEVVVGEICKFVRLG
jgi:hypothetical protein